MDALTFASELRKIEGETREKVVALVDRAREDDGLQENAPGALSWAPDPNWERAADALIELGGWVYDRVTGHTRLDRGSVVRKLRRALGYTYP